jgi:hypothetical protein
MKKNIINITFFLMVSIILVNCPLEEKMEPDTIPPETPTGLQAWPESSNTIILSWNAASGARGYGIYRHSPDDNDDLYHFIATVNATSYTDTGLLPSTLYAYLIVASNNAGASKQTSSVFVITKSKEEDPPSQEEKPIIAYDNEFWGEWIRMDTGKKWYISNDKITIDNIITSKSISFNKQSSKVIEITEGSRKYYLYASRIANSSFNGKIVSLDNTRAIGSGIGGISVVIDNLNNKANELQTTTDSQGNFTADGIIPGDDYEIVVDNQRTIVTPNTDKDNIGTITVTEGVNFKTAIRSKEDTIDMMQLYSMGMYGFVLEIINTGTEDCTAATAFLELDNGLTTADGESSLYAQLGTIEPGKKKNVSLNLSCSSLNKEFEPKTIAVEIKDNITRKTWNDSVSLRFNKGPVVFNIRSDNAIRGIIIAPDAKAYPFVTDNYWGPYDLPMDDYYADITLPWSTEDYLVVLSGATADTETVYSIGVNCIPDTNFAGLIDLGNYEPNNIEQNAAAINANDKIMSYLHKNDIDYYKINISSSIQQIKPVSLYYCIPQFLNASTVVIGGVENTIDFTFKNYTNSSWDITSVVLSTNSRYVTIGLSDRGHGLGEINAGYYASLNGDNRKFPGDVIFSEFFGYSVSPTCPSGTKLPLTLTFTDSWGNSWSDSFFVTVQ